MATATANYAGNRAALLATLEEKRAKREGLLMEWAGFESGSGDQDRLRKRIVALDGAIAEDEQTIADIDAMQRPILQAEARRAIEPMMAQAVANGRDVISATKSLRASLAKAADDVRKVAALVAADRELVNDIDRAATAGLVRLGRYQSLPFIRPDVLDKLVAQADANVDEINANRVLWVP